MKELLFREMRWFLPGPVPAETWKWFQRLPGGRVDAAFPRLDIYLVVSEREDLGLKVREGRFEIKTRPDIGTEHPLLNGSIVGNLESWTKETWDYKDPIGEIAMPFKLGPRVRMVKSRSQRKYEYNADGGGDIDPFKPRADQEYPPVGVYIEITELYIEKVTQIKDEDGKRVDKTEQTERHWTLGCEAIGSSSKVDSAFDKGATVLLKDYEGPALTADLSYGYPQHAILLIRGVS
jgi:hypothetical protein